MDRLSHCHPVLCSLEFEILHRAEIELALDKESSQSTLVESGNCGHYGWHLSLQLRDGRVNTDHCHLLCCHSNLADIFRMCIIIDKLLCVF